MNFLKEGKTNWKYILIVVILAFLVGGGIWGYCWWTGKKEVGTSEGKPPIDKCKNVRDEIGKDECYMNLAIKMGDKTYCEKITTSSIFHGRCYAELAEFLNNPSLCEKIGVRYGPWSEKYRYCDKFFFKTIPEDEFPFRRYPGEKLIETELPEGKKVYRSEELGIEFECSSKFTEVFGIPSEPLVIEGSKGKKISINFTGLYFSVYTPDYEPPLYQTWPFYDWTGADDVSKECPYPLKYEPGVYGLCKIIEIAGEKSIFKILPWMYEGPCDLDIKVYFNNPTDSPYKGLNFTLGLSYYSDIAEKVCQFYTEGIEKLEEGLKELEPESYSKFYSESMKIMENRNLSERDEERLRLFNQMLSAFRFLE